MITYLCKYTPLELLSALGASLDEPNTDAEDFRTADSVIHTSVCTHAKMLLEAALAEDPGAEVTETKDPGAEAGATDTGTAPGATDTAAARRTEKRELLLTNCCDSVRRVFDTLPKNIFSYMRMLDLPHSAGKPSVTRYAKELLKLKNEYETRTGTPFRRDILIREWKASADRWDTLKERTDGCIAILGARVSDQLRAKIRNLMPLPVVDLTCGGFRTLPQPPARAFIDVPGGVRDCERDASALSGNSSLSGSPCCSGNSGSLKFGLTDEELIFAYAEALLSQVPCTRMEDIKGRDELMQNKSIAGIVYHSVKFCDYYSFEYAEIIRKSPLPVLKIESDYTSQSEGQLDTRLRAFAESLEDYDIGTEAGAGNNSSEASSEKIAGRTSGGDAGPKKSFRNASALSAVPADSCRNASALSGNFKKTIKKNQQENFTGDYSTEMSSMKNIYIGIDSGSTSTNVAALDGDGKLVAWFIVRTGAKAQIAAENALEEVKKQLGSDAEQIRRIVATGYGREFISFADSTKTEISCHARGAHYMDPKARTIIDIGGQDSKVICLDEDGNVMNFVMNDKCAAGTGRFLEMMAQTLEMDLDEIGKRGLRWKKDLTISSTCTVFAESEVVGLIAENTDTDDIIHALNKSVAARASGMVKRVRGEGPYMMTGGVAKNTGVAKEIERRLGEKLAVMEHPDLIGAIGAALFARR